MYIHTICSVSLRAIKTFMIITDISENTKTKKYTVPTQNNVLFINFYGEVLILFTDYTLLFFNWFKDNIQITNFGRSIICIHYGHFLVKL